VKLQKFLNALQILIVFRGAGSKDFVILACAVLTQYSSATDGHTHTQTNASVIAKTRHLHSVSILAPCKKQSLTFIVCDTSTVQPILYDQSLNACGFACYLHVNCYWPAATMLSLYNAAAVTDADGMRAAGSLILWLGACALCNSRQKYSGSGGSRPKAPYCRGEHCVMCLIYCCYWLIFVIK